jgi:predicted nucleotidyltransferase component of viral defense system
MDHIILQMLDEYKCETALDYENALKEIMQEVALLGLWRAKFYEHALFYGGTALRILYGLPRFSEDLDFSLLAPNHKFDLNEYHKAVKSELEAFGFKVDIANKDKNIETQVESAFIKAETKIHFLKIQAPNEIIDRIQGTQNLKIKLEVDTNPPLDHGIEVKDLFRPIPFQVKTMPLSDLFAGKMHAVLARSWGKRVKGRDFYDYLWYLRMKTPLNLKHLETRLEQSGHIQNKLTPEYFKNILKIKFLELDVEKAKQDVRPFLNERENQSMSLWSQDYFVKSIERITFI